MPWDIKPSDWYWTCHLCGHHQFTKNVNCRKCGTQNPDTIQQPNPLHRAGLIRGGADSTDEAAVAAAMLRDWTCPSCGDSNKALNSECRSCCTQRPGQTPEGRAAIAAMAQAVGLQNQASATMPALPAAPQVPERTWDCLACGAAQPESHKCCAVCGTPNPDVEPPRDEAPPNLIEEQAQKEQRVQQQMLELLTAETTQAHQVEGWCCLVCGSLQPESEGTCRSCFSPKPSTFGKGGQSGKDGNEDKGGKGSKDGKGQAPQSQQSEEVHWGPPALAARKTMRKPEPGKGNVQRPQQAGPPQGQAGGPGQAQGTQFTTVAHTSQNLDGSSEPKRARLEVRQEPQKRPTCADWATYGHCRWGEQCAYSHATNAASSQRPTAQQQPMGREAAQADIGVQSAQERALSVPEEPAVFETAPEPLSGGFGISLADQLLLKALGSG